MQVRDRKGGVISVITMWPEGRFTRFKCWICHLQVGVLKKLFFSLVSVHSSPQCSNLSPAWNFNLLYIWQCGYVCVYVRYRRPHRRGYGAEIWHGAGVPPRERLWLGSDQPDPTPWAEGANECFWRSVQPEPCVSWKTLSNKS